MTMKFGMRLLVEVESQQQWDRKNVTKQGKRRRKRPKAMSVEPGTRWGSRSQVGGD